MEHALTWLILFIIIQVVVVLVHVVEACGPQRYGTCQSLYSRGVLPTFTGEEKTQQLL